MLGKRGDMCTCDMWGKYSRLGCRSRKMTQGGVAYKDPISPEKEIHSVWMTLETDETGYAVSKELYLDKYQIAEVKAPEGMVINSDVLEAELSYAGQEVELTTSSV